MAKTNEASTEVVSVEMPGQDSSSASPAARTRKVIIQRPAGNTDSHVFLGFNSFEGYFEFDKPVDLPADMVDYLRSQRRAEFHPDEKGNPVISHVNVLNIVDA